MFHSTLPTAEAPGKLKIRDDRKLLGTDKEKTVLSPQNQAYNQLGQDCVGVGSSVDLFLFNNSYVDIATIGQVSRLTGGEVFKYTYFQVNTRYCFLHLTFQEVSYLKSTQSVITNLKKLTGYLKKFV